MHDSGIHFDNSPRSHDMTPVLREFGIPMPVAKPLTLGEILQISKTSLGLRNTSPAQLIQERTFGVVGDYVTLFNVGRFLRLKDQKMKKWGMDGVVINKLIDSGRLDMVDGLDELPTKYNKALLDFFKEALRIRMTNIFNEENQNMSLDDYFTRYVEQLSPAWILVKGENKIDGYDFANYYTLGKHGSNRIQTSQILDHCLLTSKEVELLRERYKSFLHLPVSSYVQIGDKRVHLGDLPDGDIIELMQGKVLDMIRRKINTK